MFNAVMVKWISQGSSKALFQVRILVAAPLLIGDTMTKEDIETQLEIEFEPEVEVVNVETVVPKKSDRLNRSISARASRQKAKAIKKLKGLKAEAEAFKILNKSNGK